MNNQARQLQNDPDEVSAETNAPWLVLVVFLLRLDFRLEEAEGVAIPLAPNAPFGSLYRGHKWLVTWHGNGGSAWTWNQRNVLLA